MKTTPLVAHIIYALGTGGLENGLINIINRTPPDRYRHVIICLTNADDFANRITLPGVQVIQLHKPAGQNFRVFWDLWKTLRTLRPDVVHTRNLASLEMQLVTLLMPGIKRVHGEHGRDIHDLDGTNKKYNLLRKAMQPFVHRYIAVSRDLLQWLKHTVAIPEKKLRQIYNGVDAGKFSPRQDDAQLGDLAPPGLLPENAVVVGTVGRLAEVKNQQLLIEAVGYLFTKRPILRGTLRLVLVGDGPLKLQLVDRVKQLGLSDVVWFSGDRNDVPVLMQLMDIFILPSLAEGISNTLLEAMASGLPVIATSVGGNVELIEEGVNGRLVPVNNVVAMADALAELVDDPTLRQSMGEKGLALVRTTFNWEKTVADYLAVYDTLLGVDSAPLNSNRTQGN
ncbi:MAG: sugar transferase [Porticoccus sp.]|uniref:TIGR03088 family PEP-CTERM/XrtA system glycosyltransferase n=1 Tax=Porticoccus hydrocarbonoclasticus TaxID=1073414 RepID=UPI0006897207|nr:TIGR03088 family PEP-CTERM/XrtA system glycosyltransferase [Porticoccus hydrocarbonoclasticus]MBG58281.1 sugar transferase [Porticoccus sp.]